MPDLAMTIAMAMFLSRSETLKLIRSAPKRYKVFEVKKRTPGHVRIIAQPAREVKQLQQWAIENVLADFPVHDAAMGYRRGRNIADNARPHANQKYLLKLDFSDFFPSIKARDFAAYMRQRTPTVTPTDLAILSNILFWQPRDGSELCLSIGAPSSPLLSNLLMWDFDSQVAEFCQKRNVCYSRYADDLSFSASSSSELFETESVVNSLCRGLISPRLVINTRKTVRVSRADSRRITGLVLTNEGDVSLGRDQKRLIRARVHRYIRGRLSAEETMQLRGTLAFVNAVEPAFLCRLRDRYGAEPISAIQRT